MFTIILTTAFTIDNDKEPKISCLYC